ncbi:hypothetical protein ARMSODRAFT_807388 [Armillaria solidipes]|uniref:Uncharacterized protein n=1 Tax=Armillaria solidipes TaxID=1076256 RepID=A0A2H3B855_9AGAR|nr:hypothetical protein ARMSODRAFT_807388 [Armillaria solidipes]
MAHISLQHSPQHTMPSQNNKLPPFAELCHELNVPAPPKTQLADLIQPNVGPIPPLYLSPPVINVGSHGYQVIQGPLNHDQQWLLQGRALGTVFKNCPPGNNYWMTKDRQAPLHESSMCYTSDNRSPGGYCWILRQARIYTKQIDMRPYKAQGNGFYVYLHRLLGDPCSTIPFRLTIPFISSDTIDKALGLPGVSISRLLAQEPDVLVNANSFIPPPPDVIATARMMVEITIVGYEGVLRFPIAMECSHARMTHLGLARVLAHGFREFINRSPQPRHINETNLRLVATYLLHGSKDHYWNVAYAVVNT